MSKSLKIIVPILLIVLWSTVLGFGQTHCTFTANTGDSYSLVINSVGGITLANGDEICIFTPTGLCVGASVYEGSLPLALVAWADNSQTPEVDGYACGDSMKFKIWDASANTEYDATPVYSVGNGTFCSGAYSMLTLSVQIPEQFPNISVDPVSLSFGDVQKDSSQSLILKVHNTGTANLEISDISSSHPDFLPSPASGTVAPNESLMVTVTFTPTLETNYTENLTIASNDPDQASLVVPLSGSGVVTCTQPTHFVFQANTGDNYSLVIDSVVIDPSLEDCDEIGVFDGDLCVGAVVYHPSIGNIPLIAWADDPQTGAKDGYTCGNKMNFRIWHKGKDMEEIACANYKIGDGKFCTGAFAEFFLQSPCPDFGFAVAPDTQTVAIGDSTTYTVYLTSLYGFNSLCTLSVSGLPPEAVGTFIPETVTPTGTATLKVKPFMMTPLGTFPLIITAADGEITHSDTVVLIVIGQPCIQINPIQFEFFGEEGASTDPLSQHLIIKNCGPGTLNWEATNLSTWLSLIPTSGSITTDSSDVILSVDLSKLPYGEYFDTITISAAGSSNSPQKAAVKLTIKQLPLICLEPAVFNFTATSGGLNPIAQTLKIWNCGGDTLKFNLSKKSSWLSLNPTLGQSVGDTIPTTLSVDITGLAVGTYYDTISISGNGTNSPQNAEVILTISEQPPCIQLDKSSFSLSGTQCGSDPEAQFLQITNCGGGTLNWTSGHKESWLKIAPIFGTAPSVVSISAKLTGLAGGSYVDTLWIYSNEASNSPQFTVVSLEVSPNPAIVHISSTDFVFVDTIGGPHPAPQNLGISNFGGCTLNWKINHSSTWLLASPDSGIAPSTANLSINSSGLSAGTYYDTIVVTGNANNSPQSATVTLHLIAPPTPQPCIELIPTQFSFTAQECGVNPLGKVLKIANCGEGTLNWLAINKSSWLGLSDSLGSITTDTASITLFVNITGLSPGNYYDTIEVSGNATNSPQIAMVTLTITPHPPLIHLSQNTFFFVDTIGGPHPSPQILEIHNLGGCTLNWNITHKASWLLVNPNSGTAPATVNLSIDYTGLSAGVYADTMAVSGNASNSPQTAIVILTVVQRPEENPLIVLNPNEFHFYGCVNASNPPYKYMEITNGGGGTLNWSASKNSSWLSLNPASGTAPSSMKLSVDISGLAEGIYADTIVVSGNAENSPQKGLVFLHITPCGESVLVKMPDVCAKQGDFIEFPIMVSDVSGMGIYSFEIDLNYDPAILTATDVTNNGTISKIWGNPIYNILTPGIIKISMAGTMPLSGEGNLVLIGFYVSGNLTDSTIVHFAKMQFNDGTPPAFTQDGIMRRCPDKFSISGNVSYCLNNLPICKTWMFISGGKFDTVKTTCNGCYEFFNLDGGKDYTIEPSKNDQLDKGITAFDASLILRYVVKLINLSPCQLASADVNGNCSVSAYDASFILRLVVGKINEFPVGNFFKFYPADFVLNESNWCHPPNSILIENLSGNLFDQDFKGILYGDVSGNWGPPPPPASSNLAGVLSKSNAVELNLNPKDRFVLPISLSELSEIYSAELGISYDPNIMEIVEVKRTEFTSAFVQEENIVEGEAKIALAGSSPLSGNGDLVEITFQIREDAPEGSQGEIRLTNLGLNEEFSSNLGILASVTIGTALPKDFTLSQNYPNPFNPGTMIEFNIPKDENVNLAIYNLKGQKVKTLIDRFTTSGSHKVEWDGTAENGEKLASGIYYYRLQAGEKSLLKKMVLLK